MGGSGSRMPNSDPFTHDSPDCALEIATIVDMLESGAIPSPIFFVNKDCTGGQYPPPGNTFAPSFFGSGIFNLRAQACLQSPGIPVPLNDANTVPPDRSLCPLQPSIFGIILPSNLTVTIYASSDGAIASRVKDLGIINLNANMSQNNIFALPIYGNTFNWGSTATYPLGNSNCQGDNADEWFDADGRMKHSSLSCGMGIFPSLTTYPTVTGNDANMFCIGISATASGGLYTSRTASGGGYCDGWSDFPYGFSSGDCVFTKDEHHNDGRHECGGACTCDRQQFQVRGTIQNMALNFDKESWEIQQFLYCVGQEKLSLGGIQVQRYGQGTPACDAIVPSLCQNTAFLGANPFANKACTCVNEQRRLQAHFANLDLPVQCFTAVCSQDDPTIYRTSEQLRGCSAQICEQVIYINGNAIAADGYQTLLCNNQVYDISSVTAGTTPVPFVTAVPTGPGIQLSSTFWVSLGCLGFVILLLIFWGIRQAVLRKQQRVVKNTVILNALSKI